MKPLSKPTVFIVDDEPDQLFLMELAARRCGEFEQVQTAVDSQLAYQQLLDRDAQHLPAPRLIVTDWKMPRMTGAELACALRVHPRLRDVPVVALSSSDYASDAELALECGCREFLQKPVKFEHLILLMRDLAVRYADSPAIAR